LRDSFGWVSVVGNKEAAGPPPTFNAAGCRRRSKAGGPGALHALDSWANVLQRSNHNVEKFSLLLPSVFSVLPISFPVNFESELFKKPAWMAGFFGLSSNILQAAL